MVDRRCGYILAAWHSRGGRLRPWSSTKASRPTTRRSTGPSTRTLYDGGGARPDGGPLADLADEFGEGRIFRPYRDVRFSADKSPYKTAIAATVGAGYVQLSADGLMAAPGMYHMAPDQLERYRRAVASDRTGPGLEQLIAGLDQGQGRRARHRRPQDRAQGLPQGPSPGRAPPLPRAWSP